MLFAALFGADDGWFLLEPVGVIGFKPVAPFGTDAQIAARFTIDPIRKVDPLVDFCRAFAIPGYIFADMAVGFGGVVAEAAQNVDANFLGGGVCGVHLK